jgi:hypothetical protein
MFMGSEQDVRSWRGIFVLCLGMSTCAGTQRLFVGAECGVRHLYSTIRPLGDGFLWRIMANLLLNVRGTHYEIPNKNRESDLSES